MPNQDTLSIHNVNKKYIIFSTAKMMVDEEEKRLRDEKNNYISIKFHSMHQVCGVGSLIPSLFRGVKAEDDYEEITYFITPGLLGSRYIRNTNVTGVYEQDQSNCYVYAACSAYINTIMRIYGSKQPPSFAECYRIADYNHGDGGRPEEALRLLENHFHYGILFDVTDNVSIREAITLSVIVSFATSQQGWINIADGELLTKPDGPEDGRHATLVEGYDFDKNCFICKNSWGDETARPRFNFKKNATHDYRFIRVYFTLNSIKGKTSKKFKPKLKKFNNYLKGKPIKSAWMNEKTAIYCSDYVCEFHPDHEGPLKFLGYDINQWINISLNKT